MYDGDAEDAREEAEQRHQAATTYATLESRRTPRPNVLQPIQHTPRAIRPLPKRQRLSVQRVRDLVDSQQVKEASVVDSTSVAGDFGRQERTRDDQDDDPPRDPRSKTATTEPALEYRDTGGADSYHDQAGGTASNHPTRYRPAATAELDEDEHSLPPSLSSNGGHDGHEHDDSPPTSPAASKHEDDPLSQAIDDEDITSTLFGAEGREIRRALAKASAFSSAGLCGGLGLAGLHPSLAPAREVATAVPATAVVGVASGDDDLDEDGYSPAEGSYPSEAASSNSTIVRSAGNNKKKRKIPGISAGGSSGDDDERGSEEQDGPEPTTVIGPDNKGRAPGMASTGETGTLKVPVNPPTTAKAALAKLRCRPPHVSIASVALSARRSAKRSHRISTALQKPLKLPPPVAYSAPAMPRDGPPPLPPGSGLKGSKALKAAKKAEREREREKERIKQSLGGTVRLIDLWDPNGSEESKAAVLRAQRRRAVDTKSGYPTPPGSSDGAELTAFPTADAFDFAEPPPPTVASRWKVLNLSIERFRVAKERATKARDEERERRKEKEKEAAAAAAAAKAPTTCCDGHHDHDHDHASSAPALPKDMKGSTPLPPATVKRQPPATIPLDTVASAATAPAPAAEHPPVSSSAPLASPGALNHDAIIAAPAKKAPKKGKKKRSAHANALNVHHRDNYVPSRMPSSANHARSGEHHRDNEPAPWMTSWPASEEAIARAGGARPNLSYYAGPDEWMCAFCEYDLLFGPDPSKTHGKRKKVLKVRRKARDRASKATASTSGAPLPAPSAVGGGGDEETFVGGG